MKWRALFLLVALLAACLPQRLYAGFEMVQVGGGPIVICTLSGASGGNCAGVGGGSNLFTAATCNGTADDSAALASFNSWAVTWQASNTGQIGLLWPNSTCHIGSAGTVACGVSPGTLACPFINIKNLRILSGGASSELLIDSGVVSSLAGFGMRNNNWFDVPTVTAHKGDTCITLTLSSPTLTVTAAASDGASGTLLTVSPNTTGYSNGQTVFITNITNRSSDFFNGNNQLANVSDSTHLDLPNVPFSTGTYTSGATIGNVTGIFSVGQPVTMSGIDVQGIWQSAYGFPSNPGFYEHLHVASVNSGTSQVCFTTALKHDYLSTYPRFSFGNQFGIDPGGPATLYAMDPSWDTSVEIDLPIISASDAVFAKGSSITFNGTTFSNNCPSPTEDGTWRLLNFNTSACTIEFDKVNDAFVLQNGTAHILLFQNGSGALTMSNVTADQMSGSPASTVASNVTFTNVTNNHMQPGAIAFGRTDSFSCTNCSTYNFTLGGQFDNGLSVGIQNVMSMASGVIRAPLGATITSINNNGGHAQLVVDSTARFTQGKYIELSGSNPYGGAAQQISSIDSGTTMTIAATYTSGGNGTVCVEPSSCAIPWAIPGTNILFQGTNGIELICQVSTVTADSNDTIITLSGSAAGCSGGFPSDATAIRTHPAPIFNCSGCSGSDSQMASFAQAPANAPLYSYQTYTLPASQGTSPLTPFTMWGALSSLDINVTAASSSASQAHLSEFDNWGVYVSGSTSSYGPSVDAHTSGDRKVNSAGTVTCNGSAGACSGSDSLTTSAGLWFGQASQSGPAYGTAPSAGTSVTITVQTNQGVVNP